jgi:hypothetical protein
LVIGNYQLPITNYLVQNAKLFLDGYLAFQIPYHRALTTTSFIDELQGLVQPISYLSPVLVTGLLIFSGHLKSICAEPELQYVINFTTTGTYTVWLRGYAPNGAGDSVDLSFDNMMGETVNNQSLTGFAPRTWDWANQTLQHNAVTVEVTEPGLYTLRLLQREDGLRLDRILLTTDNNYNPIGEGPTESNRLDLF